jgi:putative transposase
MNRTFVFRLYPKPRQEVALQKTLGACRRLYNACIEQRRVAWAHRRPVSRFDQEAQLSELRAELPEFGGVYSHVLQDVVRRADLAFQAFFRRCKTGEQPGYPRFRARDRYDSFTYKQPANGCVRFENGKLFLSKVCRDGIRVFQHRPVLGATRTVTVMRKASGWYVAVSCSEVPPNASLVAGPGEVGVDVGLTHFATLSTGETIENPRFLREAEVRLKKRQRCLSRKRRGSSNRREARRLLSREWERVGNRRRDFQFKAARALVQRFGRIGVERLDIQDMVQSGPSRGLHRSIADASWRGFLNALSSKAEEAGSAVVFVEARGTTRECSGCGASVPKSLREREHRCSCGVVMDRDLNAARNILARARTEPLWRGRDAALCETGSPAL